MAWNCVRRRQDAAPNTANDLPMLGPVRSNGANMNSFVREDLLFSKRDVNTVGNAVICEVPRRGWRAANMRSCAIVQLLSGSASDKDDNEQRRGGCVIRLRDVDANYAW